MSELEPNQLAIADIQTAVANAVSLSKTYSSNDSFFSNAPEVYQPYYHSIMRKNQQWYDGYVPGIHDNTDAIYSTHLASAICSGLANKTVGSEIGFKMGSGSTDREALEFISHHWAKEVKFQTFCRQAIEYAYAMGNSLIKLNSDNQGNLYPSAVRGDMYVFTEDNRGNLTDLKCLVDVSSSTDNAQDSFMLIEHRYLETCTEAKKWTSSDGKTFVFEIGKQYPYVEYQVIKCAVAIGGKHGETVYTTSNVKFEQLPRDVQVAINKNYGAYKIGQKIPLPFKSGCLGAWNLKANGYDGNCPNMPFGKSILKDIWVELAEYDIYTSFCDKDVNNGQGTIYTPKSMDISDLQIPVADDNGSTLMPYSDTLKKMKNQQVMDGVDPDKVKPIVNQFALRANEWESLQDNCLRRMSAKLHMSPKVIASFLGKEQVEKTATEINSDDDSTIDWVKTQRSIFKPCFDDMIECVLTKMGKVGNVVVRFGNIGNKSRNLLLSELIPMLQMHLITHEEAMRELFDDKDENQLNELIDKSLKEKKEELGEPLDLE